MKQSISFQILFVLTLNSNNKYYFGILNVAQIVKCSTSVKARAIEKQLPQAVISPNKPALTYIWIVLSWIDDSFNIQVFAAICLVNFTVYYVEGIEATVSFYSGEWWRGNFNIVFLIQVFFLIRYWFLIMWPSEASCPFKAHALSEFWAKWILKVASKNILIRMFSAPYDQLLNSNLHSLAATEPETDAFIQLCAL